MNKGSSLIWIVVVVVAIAVGFVVFYVTRLQAPSSDQAVVGETPQAPSDEQAIIGEVENLDLGNLDAEFQSIEAELNRL